MDRPLVHCYYVLALQISQNFKYDIQSTKNFQAAKVSRLQSMWWSGENGRGGNFFIWNGHRRPIAPPPSSASPVGIGIVCLPASQISRKKRNLSWNFGLSEYCLFISVDFVSVWAALYPWWWVWFWKILPFLIIGNYHLGNGSEIHLSDDFCMECAPTESIIFLRAKKLVRNCCGGHL